jgi:hypothetical protein
MAEHASRRQLAEASFARFHRFATELDPVYVPRDSVPTLGDMISSELSREVRRLQAMQHCVVSLAFLSGGTELELLHVTAKGDLGAPMRRGWTYRDGGYTDSSLVTVVLPHLRCEMIRSLGSGSNRIVLPPLTRTVTPTPAQE